MKHVYIGLGLFILQLYLTFLGRSVFGVYWNPVFLFVVSAAIPAYAFWIHLRQQPSFSDVKKIQPFLNRILWTILGLIFIALAYEELRKVFVTYQDTTAWSDVILQVETLYDRFSKGEFPYAPIELTGYALQPIYMPLHWLPAGLADPLHLDARMIGYGLFAVACGCYGWYVASQPGQFLWRMVALILPTLPLWGYIFWDPINIGVSYEIVIGAYYLILAIGLLSRHAGIMTIGIILCLLSRFTLVFWLPVLAMIWVLEKKWKQSFWMWGTVALSICLFYLLPFYSKDPSMLSRGISHYMSATVGEWTGYGDPPTSWTLEYGISFAPHMKAWWPGDMVQRVSWMRNIQAALLLLLCIGSILAYRRWRHKIDMYTFSLISLYICMTVYYFFAPLTYKYYLFPFLVVSATVCGKIILYSPRKHEDPISRKKSILRE